MYNYLCYISGVIVCAVSFSNYGSYPDIEHRLLHLIWPCLQEEQGVGRWGGVWWRLPVTEIRFDAPQIQLDNQGMHNIVVMHNVQRVKFPDPGHVWK